jgi:hypothetical protein
VSRSKWRWPVAAIAAAALAVLLVASPGTSLATTGPTPLAHPPRFQVSRAEAAPFLGRFRLAHPYDRSLISGAYIAGHNERGFVEGALEVYHYDAAGHVSVILGRTYEYHSIGRRMVIDVISPANQAILARMTLHPAAGGKLKGKLKSLQPAGPPRQITLAPAPKH